MIISILLSMGFGAWCGSRGWGVTAIPIAILGGFGISLVCALLKLP